MNNYVDNSKSAKLLEITIHVFNGSFLKKVFAAIGNLFKKYFADSFTAKIFTVFDFDTAQYGNSFIIKIYKGILSPIVFVVNKIVTALGISAKHSIFVKLVSSCVYTTAKTFNGSLAGKMINHYLEGEN